MFGAFIKAMKAIASGIAACAKGLFKLAKPFAYLALSTAAFVAGTLSFIASSAIGGANMFGTHFIKTLTGYSAQQNVTLAALSDSLHEKTKDFFSFAFKWISGPAKIMADLDPSVAPKTPKLPTEEPPVIVKGSQGLDAIESSTAEVPRLATKPASPKISTSPSTITSSRSTTSRAATPIVGRTA